MFDVKLKGSTKGKREFTIPCPACGKSIKKNLKTLKKDSDHFCPFCNKKFTIGDDSFEKMAKADDEIASTIKNLKI